MNLEARGTSFATPDNTEQASSAVPNQLGFLTTDAATLRDAFNVALDQLERSRGREPGYAAIVLYSGLGGAPSLTLRLTSCVSETRMGRGQAQTQHQPFRV